MVSAIVEVCEPFGVRMRMDETESQEAVIAWVTPSRALAELST
jgi:hypothetical protein